MEFQCSFHDGFGIYGYTCKMFKTSKSSSAFKKLRMTRKHKQGKTDTDVKCVLMVEQKIETFPKCLYEKFPNLTRLSLVGCGITTMSRDDLFGLENLEELNLNGNSLTSLPDDLFLDIKKLRQIHFKDNQLERLSSKLLQPIENSLELADFRRNTKIDGYFYKFAPINDNLKRLMDLMDHLVVMALAETEPQPKRLKRSCSKADREAERH